LGISGIFILYVSLQIVSQGTLGPELANNTEAPLSAVAEKVFGTWGGQLLLLGMAISIFGCLSGDLLYTPRVVFAAARDGLLPAPLARVHPKYQTPHVAIGVYAAISCLIALSGTFKQLAVVASGSILLVYLGVSLSVLALRRRKDTLSDQQFRIPGGPIVPIASALAVIWLLFQMTAEEAIGVLGLLALITVAYLIQKVFRKPKVQSQ
jgi:amino acid transporter